MGKSIALAADIPCSSRVLEQCSVHYNPCRMRHSPACSPRQQRGGGTHGMGGTVSPAAVSWAACWRSSSRSACVSWLS